MKYFDGINNIKDLKDEYVKLIKQYHPILYSEKRNVFDYLDICMEIENEFKDKFKLLKGRGNFLPDDVCKYNGFKIMDGIKASDKKRKFIEKVSNELGKFPVKRRYFSKDSYNNYPNDEVIVNGSNTFNGDSILSYNKDLSDKIFYICFSYLCLDMDDVEKLYELCDCNAEKFKRVVLFLGNGNLEFFDFRSNLYSEESIPFFDDDIVVDGFPDYNSSLVLISEVSSSETYSSWNRFCNEQSDCFDQKIYAKMLDSSKVLLKDNKY